MHVFGSGGLALGATPWLVGCGDDTGDAGIGGSSGGSSWGDGSSGAQGSSGAPDGSTGMLDGSSDDGEDDGEDESTGELECEEAWWLCGNHAPVEESEAFDLEVVGRLPTELDGLYLRNGPNPLSGTSAHWFFGDGMVHGVRLSGGQADWYRARYVQTDILGRPPGLGMPPGLADHQANTSVVAHAGRLLCLAESGLPYELDRGDLSTLGTHDFGGLLDGPMTAHPKLDPATGEMLFFGNDVLASEARFRQVDPTGALVRSETIDLPAPVMMHDFQITPTHLVFLDMPVVFDLQLAIAGDAMPFRWAPRNGARIGVMPRAGSGDDVVWFEVELGYVFHTLNAYHDPRDPNRIVLDAVRYPELWVTSGDDNQDQGVLTRYTLDLGTGLATEQALDDRKVEFPRFDHRLQGQPHRFGYALSTGGTGTVFRMIVKYDLVRGSKVEHTLPGGLAIDELSFVPRGPGEDEGWLLGFAFDPHTELSQLLVLDAADITAEPVARVMLPRRVPHGFHGAWVPAR